MLDLTESYLQTSVATKATLIDSNPEALLHALRSLGKLGVLALRVPQEWGGAGVSEETFQSFQELVARYSGALAFLQTQHQSAAAMLVEGRNVSLMQDYLPRMSKGEVLVGVGFSQLRRKGNPLTIATAVDEGYQLSGLVPWVTGWSLFQDFIVAATLPDGRAVFGMVPFIETNQPLGGAITFSQPMQLAAMTSTNTVTATLNNWFLPAERVVSIKPAGWISKNDKQNVLRSTFLALGCARAGLDILDAASQNKALPFMSKALKFLNQELNFCRVAIKEAQQYPGSTFTHKLQLRAQAIDLAVRCAHAAVTVSSGAANSSHHDAQRVYREALVFTVSGQTTAVMEATLERLIRSTPPPSPLPVNGEGEEEIKVVVAAERTGNPTLSKLQEKSTTYSRVIHLSHVIDVDIPQWPGDPPVEFESVAELEKDGYYLRRFSLGEHSATHINAPNSFYAAGKGIDQYPAESLVVPAVVINIREKAAVNSDYVLAIADILSWEQQHGQIAFGSVVLLYTGWQEKWCDRAAFLNPDAVGNLHFPGFSSEATQFLLQKRHIAGVGIDTHGVDSGQDPTFATNRMVLEQPRIVLENLTHLDQLPPTGTTLIIGILRLKDGSGSPAAVLALINN